MEVKVNVMKDALIDMVKKFAETVPNVLMALVIIIFGFNISKIVAKVVLTALKSVGVDSIGDKFNEIDIVQKANMDIKISKIASKYLYYFMMLFFCYCSYISPRDFRNI